MIEKISVTNFKSHAQTEIKLGRVTALVGPNASGKTSILQATHHLCRLVEEGWEVVFNQRSDPSSFVRQGFDEFDIAISGTGINPLTEDDNFWKAAITFFPSKQVSPEVKLWLAKDQKAESLSKGDPLKRQLPTLIAQMLSKAFYFKGNWESISSPSYYPDVKPQILSDGTGFASTLAYLMTYEDETFRIIEDRLRAIVPTVRRVRARRAKLTMKDRKTFAVNGSNFAYDEPREVIGDELIFDTIAAKEIPPYAMSEGTLITLALLTLLQNPTSPHFFLIDDIEQGLHPLAQRQLMTTLKELAEKHDKQILLTSHSPYIVDELEAKDVWVMATDREGISHCKRLSDHPDANRAMQVLTTGEFLGAEGEDWVLPENASVEEAHA